MRQQICLIRPPGCPLCDLQAFQTALDYVSVRHRAGEIFPLGMMSFAHVAAAAAAAGVSLPLLHLLMALIRPAYFLLPEMTRSMQENPFFETVTGGQEGTMSSGRRCRSVVTAPKLKIFIYKCSTPSS
mmetsp:Transcript_10942/g.22309  ORF Transcript_10942/g.22309 Transcript_10942/m.22309 type:complete len:128 (-) Transcript_10942:215-598(-)